MGKEWISKNRDKHNKYKKDWAKKKYHSNKEFKKTINDKEKKKYKTDKDYRKQKKEYFKRWYKKNKEKQNLNVSNYYSKNKDKCKIRNRTNYYRKPLLIYFKNKCKKCGSKKNLEFHHTSYKISDTKIKLNELKKITLLLCKDCHGKEHYP